jgi:F-type H+-transporting ATPase subunit delta
VVRQYTNALYDVAAKEQRVDVVGRDIAAVAALIDSHPELKFVFQTPVVTQKKKRALVEALMASSGEVAVEVHRLLLILADRDRLMLIRDVATAYAERVMEAGRTTPADVVTAVPLQDAQRDALAVALGRATGRQVTITARVDPSILGSVVFDGSVVRQLERLREQVRNDA